MDTRAHAVPPRGAEPGGGRDGAVSTMATDAERQPGRDDEVPRHLSTTGSISAPGWELETNTTSRSLWLINPLVLLSGHMVWPPENTPLLGGESSLHFMGGQRPPPQPGPDSDSAPTNDKQWGCALGLWAGAAGGHWGALGALGGASLEQEEQQSDNGFRLLGHSAGHACPHGHDWHLVSGRAGRCQTHGKGQHVSQAQQGE